jgi:hypothetical protein
MFDVPTVDTDPAQGPPELDPVDEARAALGALPACPADQGGLFDGEDAA